MAFQGEYIICSIKSRRFYRFLKLKLRRGSYQAVALSTVSNFIIAKGAFGYADGVAYYHSENARRIPRIIFFFGQ